VNLEGRPILVTGGSGFIGAPFTKQLRQANCVVTTVGRSTESDISCDLLNPKALDDVLEFARPSIVVFGAWTTKHGEYWADPDNSNWLNATCAQIEAALNEGAQTIVTLGTCAEPGLGWDSPTMYGKAKAELAEQAASLVRSHGAQHVHARLFFPFGPNENAARLIPSTIRAALAGHDINTGPPDRVRDFIHVDDVARQLVALCGSPFDGVIDIGTGNGVSIGNLVSQLVTLCDSKSKVHLGSLPPRNEPEKLVAHMNRDHPHAVLPVAEPLSDRLAQTVSWWKNYLAADR
jgi:nucleoside-diphosphate-sugar epimerase